MGLRAEQEISRKKSQQHAEPRVEQGTSRKKHLLLVALPAVLEISSKL